MEMNDNFNAWVEQDTDVRGNNAIPINLSEFYDGAQLFTCNVFDTTSEASDIYYNDQRDNIFYRHFDFRPRRITKEEHMKSTFLEARDLMGKKEKEHVEGFQDVWAFDRLPYADLARNSSPPPLMGFGTNRVTDPQVMIRMRKDEDEGMPSPSPSRH